MNWTTIWSQSAAPSFAKGMLQGKKKTVIFKVTSQISGGTIRMRFSNIYGKHSYDIGAVTIWCKNRKYDITTEGKTSFSIKKGGYTYSDPVSIPISAGEELEIRIYYISKVQDSNMTLAEAVAYPGNHTMDKVLPEIQKESYKIQFNLYDAVVSLDRIEVQSEESSKVIVAFGDSITAMNRWVKPLRERLFKTYGGKYSLMNAGISGNCLLYEIPGFMGSSYGEMGTARFERDVLSFTNLHTVIFALGVNDISYYTKKTESVISFDKYVTAVTTIANQLHSRGVRIVAQTLTPRTGYVKKGYTQEMEALRVQINEWIRTCELFDYVFDADKLLRDENNPSYVKESFRQGDHLHPNAEGGERMAQAYDLAALTGEEI